MEVLFIIPELNPKDYDEDGVIDKETLSMLLLAIPEFEQNRINTLIENASKSYLRGEQEAYKLLRLQFDEEDAISAASSYLKEYKKQIQQGYTIIQKEKVYWLRDRTMNERQKIFDIISEGIKKGIPPDTVKQNFIDYFGMQKSQAESLARTETAYVQARGAENRYKKQGVERVKWLLGPNPCEICKPLGGKIFTWDTLPYQIPAHVRCTCALAPVIDPNEKETPYTPAPTKIEVINPIPKNTPKTKPITPKKTTIQEPVKRTQEEVKQVIKDHEAGIKDKTTEKAFIFDKKGKILLEKEGGAHAVELTDDELKLLKGHILTHNHPSAGSFSGADIKTSCMHELNEVRATGAKGTYIMKLKDGSNFSKELWDEKISEIYDKEFKNELKKHNMRMAKNELTKEESVQLLSKVLWVKVTRGVPELDYTFIKW